MPATKPFKVAVVGGGIAGVALTVALNERGIPVHLYERHHEFDEYGAGLGIAGMAAEAMKMLGPKIWDAFQEVVNLPPNKEVNLDAIDGYNEPSTGNFQIPWDGVSGAVHRVHFLKAISKNIPDEIVSFGKQLEDIHEPEDPNEQVELIFKDGSRAKADVIVGCDGIGSHVRRYLVGEDHPSVRAKYAHRYVYRALMPMDTAASLVGYERARTNTLWMGHGSEVVCVSIAGGTIMSMAIIMDDPKPWPSEHHMVLPAKKSDVIEEFHSWGPTVRKLIENIDEHVDRWALFDLAENPVPYFSRGRIVLAGDAAHATTPNLGSGAGFSLEDVAVLTELLADERVNNGPGEIAAALKAYDTIRRPRAQWLPIGSRDQGDLMSFGHKEAKDNIEMIKERAMKNYDISWNGSPIQFAKDAQAELGKLLAAGQ